MAGKIARVPGLAQALLENSNLAENLSLHWPGAVISGDDIRSRQTTPGSIDPSCLTRNQATPFNKCMYVSVL